MRDKILDDTSCLSYYIFSDWHCSFVKRNKKKILYLLCIASPTNNFRCQNKCDKWGYNWFNKLQVCSFENELADFYWNLERRNVSRSSSKSFKTYILFSKDNMYDNMWKWAKVYKAEFWDDETTPLKELTSSSSLPKCYVCRGSGWG